ncbi:MAG: hypothetical protein IIU65_04880, partial [Clostridia bacterium]|nr:hypothetical protein [Clostridia bacterium]
STSTTKPSQTTQKVELGTIGSISVKVSGKNKVEITCPKVANAKSYEVYRANYGSKSFVRLGKVSKSPFVDNTVKGGKKYVYKVRAINGDVYKDSKQSKAVSIMNFKAKAKFKATPAKKNMTVKITGKVKYANGYQVAYSTNAKFKKKLTKTVIFKTKKTIKKLKSGTKYYVRVRAYKTINGKKVYGSWTAKKSIKVK